MYKSTYIESLNKIPVLLSFQSDKISFCHREHQFWQILALLMFFGDFLGNFACDGDFLSEQSWEGSFDDSVRELEQLPQRVFCVTVWDTPPPLVPLNFTFPKFARREICPRRLYVSVSVKLLFTRILKLLAPDIWIWYYKWKWSVFIEISFGLFPGGVPSDLEKVAIIENKAVL